MAVQTYASVDAILRAADGILRIEDAGVEVLDADGLRGELIDRLIATAVFGDDEARAASRWLIRVAAPAAGAYPASIHDLYLACGRGEYANMTTPAINVRGLTFDVARTVLQAATQVDTKMVVFELARSEMGYTEQRPGEYASNILAAAIKEGWQGPVFIQGDHYQLSASKYASDPEGETTAVRELIAEAIAAGYFNIDVDASTLVDLDRPTVSAQQRDNYERTAELTEVVRDHQPEGIEVSVGGEIGEVGSTNSTEEELHAFMEGYLAELKRRSEARGRDLTGISKISVQTGTSHGGVPLADGTIADVSVDFDTLGRLSEVARARYGLGGAVQHGASTLPESAFDRFAQAGAVEVHLATAFQNQIYDSAAFPADLLEDIYDHLAANHAGERKEGQTDAQFYYTTRKRGFGPFKRQLWGLPDETREAIMDELRPTFALIMERLGVAGSGNLAEKFTRRVDVPVPAPEALRAGVAH
jgi:fructose/tagatose bisphosphate aldolase